MSHLIEAYPPSGNSLIRHGAIAALCEKLLSIEYMDVAEQALNVLGRMSEHQASGVNILRGGGLMAVLQFLDFFALNVQRKAANTASNLVRAVPKVRPLHSSL